jgi:hypothetical protein
MSFGAFSGITSSLRVGTQRKPSEVVFSRQSTVKSRISPALTVTFGSVVGAEIPLERSTIHSPICPERDEMTRARIPSPLPLAPTEISPPMPNSPARGAIQRRMAALSSPAPG